MEENSNLEAYHSKMPYPEIKVTEKNSYYANLLKNDYVGLVSEMTAINQYVYHHIEMENVDKEIADMVMNISIVEMRHLEVLAKLIDLLGEKPIFRTEEAFWNADYIYYGENIIDQLEADLKSEYQAIENYEKNIELIDDPYIINILRRIILDEEVHIRLFTKAIEKLKKEPEETLTDIIGESFPQRRPY